MYLNNAATSFPKPQCVTRAVVESLAQAPEDADRSHGDGGAVERCRQRVAKLLGGSNPSNVCFAASGTDALNTAIIGSVRQGDEIVSTVFDHNSVARPLKHLELTRGAVVRRVGLDAQGGLAVDELRRTVSRTTRLVILTHVSNVTGAIVPIHAVAQFLADNQTTLIIDASQSIGVLRLDVSELPGRVLLAAAAHKGLYAPSGMGVLWVPDDSVGQRVYGGTGVRSEESEHPRDLPYRHEAGTPNYAGLAGLEAGADYVMRKGYDDMGGLRSRLVHLTRHELSKITGVELAPLPENDGRAGIVAFKLASMTSDEVGFALASAFGIVVRSGLHCAPQLHRALCTMPDGLVRASFGAFNDEKDANALVDAIARLAHGEV